MEDYTLLLAIILTWISYYVGLWQGKNMNKKEV